MDKPTRREWLQMAAAAAAVPLTTQASQPPGQAGTLRFFPGFSSKRVTTSGA